MYNIIVSKYKSGALDGGGRSPCRMLIIRSGNVAVLIFRKTLCRPVDFKKTLCCMSLRPNKGHVAVLILGVFTPKRFVLTN